MRAALPALALLLAAMPALHVPAQPAAPFGQLACPGPTGERPLEQCNLRATVHNGPANEIDLALDPRDPQHMVMVAKGYHYTRLVGSAFLGGVITPHAASFDGGLTWHEGFLQPLDKVLVELPGLGPVGLTSPPESDPVVEFAADGAVLAQTLRLGGGLRADGPGLPMYRSADGGLSFQEVGYAYVGSTDKNWMVTDPLTGNVYAVTLHQGGTGFVKSTDHGFTWSAPRRICNCALPGIDVGPEGVIYVVGLGGGAVKFVRSTDQGATWSAERIIAPHPTGPTNPCNGRLFRMSTIAVVAASRRAPDVFVAWAAKTPGAPELPDPSGFDCPDLPFYDVFLAQSHDGGLTWSAPRRMNDDPTDLAAQFMAQVAVSPSGRDVHVAWMDQRVDLAGVLAEVYYVHSPDAGQSWDPNLKVSDRPFVTTLSHHQNLFPHHTGVFVGDYIGLQATDSKAVVAFPDTRYGRADAFVATIV